MTEDLKKFEAVLVRITRIRFEAEDESDALEIAEDLARLEGAELIGLNHT